MTSERLSLDLIELPRPSAGILRRLRDAFVHWRRTAQQREVLAGFDERMLRDVGLTEADVWRETRFPSSWDTYR
ncbi:MAG TPA: DUF1127 domain-containing protein [Polyangiales bacterium]|nr:DUF1127 domain-containing protein [Polyangiales bacterium]